MKRLVIFDWDGTLMDSVGHIVSAMQAAADELGLSVPPASAVRHIIGLSLEPAIRQLFGNLSDSQRSALIAAYRRHYLAADAFSAPLFEGVIPLLEQLRQQNYLLAVATGKSRKGLDRMLRQHDLESLFRFSCCACEAPSKPDPQMLTQILAQAGLPAGQAVMVGDTSFDMAMAAALDMPRIGVSYGAHPADKLRPYRPLAIVDRPLALLAYL